MLRYLSAIAAIGITLAMSSNAAPIIYQITPRVGDAPGWGILGGEIVTDGTIGDIYPENFLTWEIEISSPAGVTVLRDGNSGIFLYEVIYHTGYPPSASLFATTERITMIPQLNVIARLYFASHDIWLDEIPDQLVGYYPATDNGWTTGGGAHGGGMLIDNTIDRYQATSFWAYSAFNPNQSAFLTELGPVTIASTTEVPEPSSLLIAVIAGIVWSLLVTVRK